MPKGYPKDTTKPRYWLGRKHTEETRIKMSQTRLNMVKQGLLFSEETRIKMSESGK